MHPTMRDDSRLADSAKSCFRIIENAHQVTPQYCNPSYDVDVVHTSLNLHANIFGVGRSRNKPLTR
jgi:hypothetical protein